MLFVAVQPLSKQPPVQVLAEVNATQPLNVGRHIMLSLVLHKIVDTSQASFRAPGQHGASQQALHA